MRSKEDIRQGIWKLLVEKRVARLPGAEGRISNFVGTNACAKVLAKAPSGSRPWS